MQRLLFLLFLLPLYSSYSMQRGLSKLGLPKKSYRVAAHNFNKHERSKSFHSVVDEKTVQTILKPLKTEQDKRVFYNLITNRQNAIVWKTIKIKKKKLPIYCMPYQSFDDHLALIFLLKSVHKNNLALAYQKFFHALSADIEQYLKTYTLMTNNEPTKEINELCLNTATEKIVGALQRELEPELKIITVTL